MLDAFYDIRWNHLKNTGIFLQRIIISQGAKRSAKFLDSNWKDPFTSDIIWELIEVYGAEVYNILTMRSLIICVIFFLSLQKLANSNFLDRAIKILEDHLPVMLP